MIIPTCTAPMPSDSRNLNGQFNCRAVTMIELVVAITVISVFVVLAQINFFGLLRRSTFEGQVQELVLTMQKAASTAAETGKRYEVVIDLAEQGYVFRCITGSELSQDMEGQTIVENEFSDSCWISYVQFDDLTSVNDTRAWFWVGPSGWQYGGKIVLLDENSKPYSIVVNRLNRIVTLEEGDVQLLTPKSEEEIPF